MKRTGSCQSIHALFRGLAIFLLAASPCLAEKLPYGASNLLQMLDELHCAANETEASRKLVRLCTMSIDPLGIPADQDNQDGAGLHIASLDIMLRVLDEAATDFPSLAGEIERCVLQWGFCALRRERAFVDIFQRGDILERCPPAEPYPAGGSGLERWGFKQPDPSDRRIPGLMLNSGLGHADHTRFIHRINHKQCFPHPVTGKMPDEETLATLYGSNPRATEKNDWTSCVTVYPLLWSPRCEIEAGHKTGHAAGYRRGYAIGLERGHQQAREQLRSAYESQKLQGMQQGRVQGIKDAREKVKSIPDAALLGDDFNSAMGRTPQNRTPATPSEDKPPRQPPLRRIWSKEAFDQAVIEGLHEGETMGEIEGRADGLKITMANQNSVREAGFRAGFAASYAQARIEALNTLTEDSSRLTQPPPPQTVESRPMKRPSVDPPAPVFTPVEQPPQPLTVADTPSVMPLSSRASTEPLPGKYGFSGNLFHAWRLVDGSPEVGANISWAPADYWFVRGGVSVAYRDSEDPLTYSWGMGYDDWHTGTWSVQLNNWGPILPREGIKIDGAVLNIGYKLDHTLLTDNDIAASVSIDIPVKGEKAINTTWQWSPAPTWFIRAGLSVTEDDPSRLYWSYGFGRWDWRAFTWTLQYNNWGSNPAFTPNFKENGTVMLGWGWAF